MEYLLWGAGRNTYQFINEYYSYYFYKNPIKAIVDNNSDKWESNFLGYSVIGPKKIKNYKYDKILLSSHYDVIINQIVKELGIEREKIITREEFLETLYEQLVNEYLIFEKRVLIIGEAQRYLLRKQTYTSVLNIVGIVNYSSLEELAKYSFDYILLMNPMNTPGLNSRNISRLELEEHVIKQIEMHGVKRSKILSSIVYPILMEREYPIQWGEENEVGKINAWEKFFYQPGGGYTLSDVQNSRNIIIKWVGGGNI